MHRDFFEDQEIQKYQYAKVQDKLQTLLKKKIFYFIF